LNGHDVVQQGEKAVAKDAFKKITEKEK